MPAGKTDGAVTSVVSASAGAGSLSQADFGLIADSLAHIVWIAGPDGLPDYVNRRGWEHMGSAAEAGQRWDWMSLVHPDDLDQAQSGWERAIRTGTPYELQLRIRRAPGEFRRHAVRSLPVTSADGEIVKWVGTATDIEDRTRLEDHLSRAERESAESLVLLQTLQSAARVGFAFVDRELRLVHINERFAAINGAKVEEHLGRPVADVMPTIWPQIEPILRSVLETGQPVVKQEIVGASTAPGQVLSWLASCYPILVDGESTGIGIVVRDVSRRRVLTERRQVDEFRSVVIANMAEGLFAFDSEGRMTFLNAAASRMLGWCENELRGKSVHSAIHFQRPDGSAFPEDECEVLNVLTLGRTIRVDSDAFTRKDGSIFPVAYSAAPLFGGADVTGGVVVFRDTTAEQTEQGDVRRALDALAWVGRTRDALDEGRLILYSQPIIPLAGGQPSEELLLRMIGREGEIIRPAIFLPTAEKYGLIGEIDKLVVTQAARLAARGRRVHANLSAVSISNLHLLAYIESALSEAGADPSDLVFEITETALVEDIDAGAIFAGGLGEIGCHLALDDFGTGYGSFSTLKKIPIEYLKIDSEFVLDLVSNPANQHVVKAIAGLAKGLGQQTVAEGVEDRETLALLQRYGVDFAQGYHLGRPGPVAFAGAGA